MGPGRLDADTAAAEMSRGSDSGVTYRHVLYLSIRYNVSHIESHMVTYAYMDNLSHMVTYCHIGQRMVIRAKCKIE